MKLQNSEEMPDYADPFVALFYSLWFLPSQVNLACAVVEGSLDLNDELRLIDYGCGTGAMAIALVLIAGSRGPLDFPHQIQVHGIDCKSMRQLGTALWEEIRTIARRVANTQIIYGLRRVYPSHFGRVAALLDREGTWLEGHWNVALSALHVAYGANYREVQQEIQALWVSSNPVWGAVTTARLGKKPEYAKQIAPWPMPVHKSLPLPFSGVLPNLTDFRREILEGIEGEDTFSGGGLLWTAVDWNVRPGPFVLRYPQD